MIGLDTNILLRLIVEDDARQTAQAIKYLKTNCNSDNPPFISDLALAETVWALKRNYGFRRNEIAEALLSLFVNTLYVFESEDMFLGMLQTYQNTNVDFADILITNRAIIAGCTECISFDQKAIRAGIMAPVT